METTEDPRKHLNAELRVYHGPAQKNGPLWIQH